MNRVLSSRLLLVTAVGASLLTACASEERIRDKARGSLASGEFEAGVKTVETGLKQQPDSIALRSELLTAKAEALDGILQSALRLRRSNRPEDALKQVERALALDPGNRRLLALVDELNVDRDQLVVAQKARELHAAGQNEKALRALEQALKSSPRNTVLLDLQRQIESERREQQVSAAQSSLAETRGVTLDFKDANLRTVLDVVSRNSGINFVIDKDVKPDARVTVYLREARLEDALDLVTSTNQLAKKVLDPKTLVIYPNTLEKQKEYQEQVVRVFYLAGSEAKGAASFLRSMLKIREPFVEERTNMLALRESPENIALAERLIALYDAGDPEVLLEVEVLEVSTRRLLQLGVNPPTSFSLTPLIPEGASQLTLGNVGSLTRNQIALGLGGATVDFKRELGDFTTLANPRIRVKNREKAAILIGDKIPVVTTTTGIGGFVSDSVNYLDVGLKINVEPTVYADDEVAIKVGLEVSTLGTAVKTASGTLAYQIGTRNANTVLRLKDGETQMLAGLISRDERKSATGIAGLTDIPVLGRLFSDGQDSANKTELVLAITPRVLANIRRPLAQEAELWVGTESEPRLRPYGGLRTLAEPPRSENMPPGTSSASLAATRSEGSKAGGRTDQEADGQSMKQPGRTAGAIQLGWSAPEQVKAGDTFEVRVQVKSALALRGLPTDISFDKSMLELVESREGDYFRQGDAATSFSQGAQDADGRMTLGVIRKQATGAQGEGTAFVLKFRALNPGRIELRLLKAVALTLKEPPPPLDPVAPLRLTVQP